MYEESSSGELTNDVYGRPLRDLRISLTDRCNFRCKYCMPKEVFGPNHAFHPMTDLLTFEEIIRLVKLFAECGVEKIRLTGGEPLLRGNIESLITSISQIPQIKDITLTTNGSLLDDRKAKSLRSAGLNRITISLDSLDNQTFMTMNDVQFPVKRVLDAIDSAHRAGLSPVKINMVVRRGVNDHCIHDMADYFRGSGCILRFIEFMDVGNTNGWRLEEVVSSREILESLSKVWPLVPVSPNYRGEVASRYRYADGRGEIGFISSVTGAFCSTCTRSRISSDGFMYTCLFGNAGFDFKRLLRDSSVDEGVIRSAIQEIWGNRNDRYSEIRTQATARHPRIEMSQIGG